MIILDTAIGDIVTIDNVRYQQVVVSLVVDKEADLPAQNALGNNQIMVAPSICHCTKESTDWQMDSTGAWYRQKSTQDVNATVQLDLTNYYTSAETDSAISTALGTSLSNYYTKTQTDTRITYNINSSLSNYYNKSAIDTMLNGYTTFSDVSSYVSSYVSSSLSEYYTKTEINTMRNDYYTKSDIDYLVYTKSQSDARYYTQSYITTNYYTKSEVDALISGGGGGFDPDDYYTKTQADNKFATKQSVDITIEGIGYDLDDRAYDIYYCFWDMSSGLAIPSNFDLNNIDAFEAIKASYNADSPSHYQNLTAFGKFYCTAINAQTSQHKPVTQPGGYGVWMEAFGTADNNRFVQTLIYNVTGSASNRNQIYKRFYSSGGWSNWFIVGMTEIIP